MSAVGTLKNRRDLTSATLSLRASAALARKRVGSGPLGREAEIRRSERQEPGESSRPVGHRTNTVLGISTMKSQIS
jgi:hypothetical protein